MSSVWTLVTQGKYEEACAMADAEYRKTADVFPLRNKVYALLLQNKIEETERLCIQLLESSGGEVSQDYLFLGISYWFQGRSEQAIATWQEACNAKFFDAAGGIDISLLLFYAATKLHDELLTRKATVLLARIKNPKVANWPGPIAGYVVGAINECEMLACLSRQPILRARQTCRASFYTALKKFAKSDVIGWKKGLHNTINIGKISSCLLEFEYYLARWELSPLSDAINDKHGHNPSIL